MKRLNVLSSNRVEILYEGLKVELFKKSSSPFARRLIIVPSPAMKSWLLLKLATDPDCNIAAGLEICYLDRALDLIRLSTDADRNEFIPNEMELSLILEVLISKKIALRSNLNTEEQAIWNPLFHHLRTSSKNNKKAQSRLTALCSRLSSLFLQYGRHGCKMLESWENSLFSKCWQEQLWKDLKVKYPQLCFAYQRLPQISKEIQANKMTLKNMQIHVFGLSFIPDCVHQFFSEIACAISLNYFVFSPCQTFWSDICSDKEKIKLQRYWEKKGISKPQQQALELFLRERNRLLANFGRMGREMSLKIETSTDQIVECYQIPGAVQTTPHYIDELPSDIILDQSDSVLMTLQAVQSDITLLRNANVNEKIQLSIDDHSVQIHVAYTKYREIEILYNTLLHLLTKHAKDEDPITPSDIIVMAPDLMLYESMICSIFGSEESHLDFQIVEMQQLAKSSLLQGFLHLLSLASSRWEADDLLQLLEYPEFQCKQGFSLDDIQQIRTWVQQSGAHWGLSTQHRNELLEGDHGSCQLIDTNPAGTWEYSMSRLVTALAIEPAGLNHETHCFVPPIDEMETSQAELLAKWISLIKNLQKDLKPLSNGTQMELLKWAAYLEKLKENYLQVDISNKEEGKCDASLSSHLWKLASAANLVKDECYSFETIHFQLEKSLKNEASSYREAHLQGVRFCSLLPMRALPAKIVVLIGMDEGAFPRKEIPFSLNEMHIHPEADYSPSQTDFDRYLFLEALLSARRYFILSYVGYSFEDSRELSPSLLVQELLSYLDSGYQFGNKVPSNHCVHKHPFDSFNRRYFSNTLFPTYIQNHYRLAQAHYQKSKKNAHRFIPNFSVLNSRDHSVIDKDVLTVKELGNFAANPLKAYFNKSLNIYLDASDRNQIHNEEPFSLNGLDKYQLRMEGIKIPALNLLNKASKTGKLPRGLFKKLSSEGMIDEIDKMHLNFAQNQVEPLKIRPLILSEHCERPMLDKDGGWEIPPLYLDFSERYKHIKIVGTLKEVSLQGLIVHQKRDLVSILKVWPQYLILCLAIKKFDLSIKPQLISSKDVKPFIFPLDEIGLQMTLFLDYYFTGMQSPSPMIPEWVPDLLKGDPDHFAKSMRSSLEGSAFSSLYNDYALWLFRDRQQLPTTEELYQHWQPISETLFSAVSKELLS